MEWLILYTVFATTTGICSWLFLYVPVFREIIGLLDIENSFLSSPIISQITFIVLSTIAAPLLFSVLFNEERTVNFKNALKKEMLKSK